MPEFFLLFLPPLWPFFPLFVELEAFLPAGLSVDVVVPPPVWATERVAPSNRANAMVSSFFIESPSDRTSVFIDKHFRGKILGYIVAQKSKKEAA